MLVSISSWNLKLINGFHSVHYFTNQIFFTVQNNRKLLWLDATECPDNFTVEKSRMHQKQSPDNHCWSFSDGGYALEVI